MPLGTHSGNAESAAAELEKLTRMPEGVAIVPSGIEDRTDEAVEALLDAGADPRATDAYGSAALAWAARGGHAAAAEALLAKQAPLEQADEIVVGAAPRSAVGVLQVPH